MEWREPQAITAPAAVDREAAAAVAVNLFPADPVATVDSMAVDRAAPQDSPLAVAQEP